MFSSEYIIHINTVERRGLRSYAKEFADIKGNKTKGTIVPGVPLWELYYRGLLGEYAFYRLMIDNGTPIPINLTPLRFGDQGYDFKLIDGTTIDIKYYDNAVKKANLVFQPGRDGKPKIDANVFVQTQRGKREGDVRFIGWHIAKDDQDQEWDEFGYGLRLCVKQENLIDIRSLLTYIRGVNIGETLV